MLTHFESVEQKPRLAATSAAHSDLQPQAVAEDDNGDAEDHDDEDNDDEPASADGQVADAAVTTAIEQGCAEAMDARPKDAEDTAEKQAQTEAGEAPTGGDVPRGDDAPGAADWESGTKRAGENDDEQGQTVKRRRV